MRTIEQVITEREAKIWKGKAVREEIIKLKDVWRDIEDFFGDDVSEDKEKAQDHIELAIAKLENKIELLNEETDVLTDEVNEMEGNKE